MQPPRPNSPLLCIERLTRRPWFEDFELDLGRGEIVVLRGPSGSGKTLLLRAVADLDPTDGGTVRLAGAERSVLTPQAWRSQAVYLHQRPVLLPRSAKDNLDRVRRLAVQRQKAGGPTEEAFPRSLLPSPSAEASNLSGGEAQRLALERALALEPSVLLLDEATSALDDAAARQVESVLAAWVAKEARAILWVTHDKDLAGRIGALERSFP